MAPVGVGDPDVVVAVDAAARVAVGDPASVRRERGIELGPASRRHTARADAAGPHRQDVREPRRAERERAAQPRRGSVSNSSIRAITTSATSASPQTVRTRSTRPLPRCPRARAGAPRRPPPARRDRGEEQQAAPPDGVAAHAARRERGARLAQRHDICAAHTSQTRRWPRSNHLGEALRRGRHRRRKNRTIRSVRGLAVRWRWSSMSVPCRSESSSTRRLGPAPSRSARARSPRRRRGRGGRTRRAWPRRYGGCHRDPCCTSMCG